MLLRGPQTLSELNTRTQRMELFSDKDEPLHCVERLCKRALPCVVRLAHQPGQRGERFAHRFSGIPELEFSQSTRTGNCDTSPHSDESDSLVQLESQIISLNKSIRELAEDNRVLRQQLQSLYELTGHSLPEMS